MRNIDISKEQLIDESGSIHRRVAELAELEARVFGADDFLGMFQTSGICVTPSRSLPGSERSA